MKVTVTRQEPVPPPVEKVLIEMNEAEARTLVGLCMNIAGSAGNYRINAPTLNNPDLRTVTDALYSLLKNAGIR